MNDKNLFVVVAVSREKNGFGIAKEGKIPWHFPFDLSIFSAITKMAPYGKENSIIMGSATWNTIAPGLPGRKNIVLSSGKTILKDGNYVLTDSFDKAVELSSDCHKIFAIGGLDVVKDARNHARYNKEYITLIEKEYETDRNLDRVPLDVESFKYDYEGVEIKYYNYNDYTVDDSDQDEYEFSNYKNLPKHEEYQYLSMLHFLMNKKLRTTRNAPTRSSFGSLLKFKLSDETGRKILPVLTTKKINVENIWLELEMFLNGSTDTNFLLNKGIKIWEQNTNKEFLNIVNLDYPEGFMGPMYGYQWRFYDKPYSSDEDTFSEPKQGVDQLSNILNEIQKDPHSRRLCITTFNPKQVKEGVLYPCHGLMIQFYVSDDYELHCLMYQRSADVFLGLPYNITSYALLTHLFVHCLNNRGMNLKPGKLKIILGDWHLYHNHQVSALKQILREPLPFPDIEIKSEEDHPWNYKWDNFTIKNYTHGAYIKADMTA